MKTHVLTAQSQNHLNKFYFPDSASGRAFFQLRFAGIAQALSVLAVNPRPGLCRARLAEPSSFDRVQLFDDLVVSALLYQLYIKVLLFLVAVRFC